MSVDLIVTLAIGSVAAIYVGLQARKSVAKLLAPKAGCSSCSGCGTPKGHAANEESCDQKTRLPVLK